MIEYLNLRSESYPPIRDDSSLTRALCVFAYTSGQAVGNELIKWNFNDEIIEAYRLSDGQLHALSSIDTIANVSAMKFILTPAVNYDYTIQAPFELDTTVQAVYLTGNLTDLSSIYIDSEVTEYAVVANDYFWVYYPNPFIPEINLYANYESTKFSPLFYRDIPSSGTYSVRFSAEIPYSLMSFTNLLTHSGTFDNSVWTTSNNMYVTQTTNTVTPQGSGLVAALLEPVSAIPFKTIDTITDLYVTSLPLSFLSATNTYIIPMTGCNTSGEGVSAVFSVVVANSSVSAVSVIDGGKFFNIDDIVYINGYALGLDDDFGPAITFSVEDTKDESHSISRIVGPLPANNYTFSVFAQPSGGKYLYIDGFNQGPVIFDVEQTATYNLGSWSDATVEPFDPTRLAEKSPIFKTTFNGPVNTIALSSSASDSLSDAFLIIGGSFTKCNNIYVGGICAIDLTGGTGNPRTTGFAPSGIAGDVYTIHLSNEKVYVGGKFDSYRGTLVNNIVRLDNDGRIDTTFTGNTNGQVNAINVLNSIPVRVFIGGEFSQYNSQPNRHGLVCVDEQGAEHPPEIFDIRN